MVEKELVSSKIMGTSQNCIPCYTQNSFNSKMYEPYFTKGSSIDADEAAQIPDYCARPKIVFIKASEPDKPIRPAPGSSTAHPLSDEPFEFNRAEPGSKSPTMLTDNTRQGTARERTFNAQIPDFYARPKIVFIKASEPDKPIRPAPGSSTAHPLSDEPFEFKRAEPGSKSPTMLTDNTRQGTARERTFNSQIPDFYARPKIVFIKASEPDKPIRPAPGSSTAHPLSDEPFEFKRAEPGSKSPTMLTDNTRQGTARDRTFNAQIPDFYARPKMIFHKASEPDKPIRPAPESSTAHSLKDEPFEFNRAEPGSKSPTILTDNTRQGTARDRTFNEEPYGKHGFYNKPDGSQDERSAEGNYEKQYSGFGPRHGGFGLRRGGFSPRRGGIPPRHGGFGPRFGRYKHDGLGFQHGGFHKEATNQYQHSGFQRKELQSAGRHQQKRGHDKFDKPTDNAVTKKQKIGHLPYDLSDFVVMNYSIASPNFGPTTTLDHSANANHVVLNYQFEQIADFGVLCNLFISDIKVASVLGTTKADAKKSASEEALKSLKEICYTILVKKNVDNDGEGLTKDELVSTVEGGGNVISDNNIGNMLLRKMGWAGGGVGKHATGIAEPVKAGQVIGRQGLGLMASQGIDGIFYEKVQGILDRYVKSSDQNDLSFSPEFTKEERLIIHQMARRHGLKTSSRGKGESRFFVLSRKRSGAQLLNYVMSCGGATSKYEVVPPGKQKDE